MHTKNAPRHADSAWAVPLSSPVSSPCQWPGSLHHPSCSEEVDRCGVPRQVSLHLQGLKLPLLDREAEHSGFLMKRLCGFKGLQGQGDESLWDSADSAGLEDLVAPFDF